MSKEKEICKKLSSSSFQASDIFYGVGGAILGLSILIWIPFLWWAIPFWLVIAPFCGTYWRQEYYRKKLIKLKDND